jgi:hypothetical protein
MGCGSRKCVCTRANRGRDTLFQATCMLQLRMQIPDVCRERCFHVYCSCISNKPKTEFSKRHDYAHFLVAMSCRFTMKAPNCAHTPHTPHTQSGAPGCTLMQRHAGGPGLTPEPTNPQLGIARNSCHRTFLVARSFRKRLSTHCASYMLS